MPGIVDAITGAGATKARKAAEATALANQRKTLADLAAEQGQLDQAAAAGGQRQRGRRLLTFLNGSGQATLG